MKILDASVTTNGRWFPAWAGLFTREWEQASRERVGYQTFSTRRTSLWPVARLSAENSWYSLA
jgi:hypothetical protein